MSLFLEFIPTLAKTAFRQPDMNIRVRSEAIEDYSHNEQNDENARLTALHQGFSQVSEIPLSLFDWFKPFPTIICVIIFPDLDFFVHFVWITQNDLDAIEASESLLETRQLSDCDFSCLPSLSVSDIPISPVGLW